MASVHYLPIDGEVVSAEWHALLTAARKAGVWFHVNEGHRTFARQAQLYALYRAGRGALAAVPSPNAPHIRTGRIDHAIDFNGAANIMAWLHRHGVPSAYLAVRGESWHVEARASELTRAAALHGGPRTLKKGMKGEDVQQLQVNLRRVGRWPKKRKTGKTFGTFTKYMLMGYQHSQGLRADGIYGPNTRKHLVADAKRALARSRR